MKETESRHFVDKSENMFYDEELKFTREIWKSILHYTDIATENNIRKYMYNKICKKLMRGEVSAEYAKGYLEGQRDRRGMKGLAEEYIGQDNKNQ